jgi:hypothetical protein
MQATPEVKKIISDHLEGIAANDPLFAETLKKPTKNINDCVTYIMNQVRKKGNAVMLADAEVFGMAIHYYDEDNIEVGKPVSGNVSTSKVDNGARTTPMQTALKTPKKADKKVVPAPASLFD